MTYEVRIKWQSNGDKTVIEQVVKKRDLRGFSEIKENLAYWLSKSPEERVEAVERIRRMFYGSAGRLQRTARVIQL